MLLHDLVTIFRRMLSVGWRAKSQKKFEVGQSNVRGHRGGVSCVVHLKRSERASEQPKMVNRREEGDKLLYAFFLLLT